MVDCEIHKHIFSVDSSRGRFGVGECERGNSERRYKRSIQTKWGERTRIENSSRFQLADDLAVAGVFEIEAQWLSIRDSKSERSVHLYDSNVSIEMETEMTLHDNLFVEMVVAAEGAIDFRVTVEEVFF